MNQPLRSALLLSLMSWGLVACPNKTGVRPDPAPVERPRPKDADLTRRSAAGVLGHFAVTMSVYPERLLQARAKRRALFTWLESLDSEIPSIFSELERPSKTLEGFDPARPTLLGLLATEQDALLGLAAHGVPLSPNEEPRVIHLRASVPATDVDTLVTSITTSLQAQGFVSAPPERSIAGVASFILKEDETFLGLTRRADHVVLDLFLNDEMPPPELDVYVRARLKALQAPGPMPQDAATLHFLEGHGELAVHVDAARVFAYLTAPASEGFALRYMARDRVFGELTTRHKIARLLGRWARGYRGQDGDRTLSLALASERIRLTENLRAHTHDAYKASGRRAVTLLPAGAPTLFSVHMHESIAPLVAAPAPALQEIAEEAFGPGLEGLEERDDALFVLFFFENPWLTVRYGLEAFEEGMSALVPTSLSLLYEASTLEAAGSVAMRAAFPKGETREEVRRFDRLFRELLQEFGVVATESEMKTDVLETGPSPEYRMAYATRAPLFSDEPIARPPGWYASMDASRVAVTVNKVDSTLGEALLSMGRVRLSSRVFAGHRATILGFGARAQEDAVLEPVKITKAASKSPVLSAGERCLRQEFDAAMTLFPAKADEASMKTYALAMEARSKSSIASAMECARQDPKTAAQAELLTSAWAYVMADLNIALRRDASVAKWLEPACKARPLPVCVSLPRFQKKKASP